MFWGADTARLAQQAAATQLDATRLETLLGALERAALSVAWTGPDAEAFKVQVRAEIALALKTSQRMHGLGAELTGHADEQDDASQSDQGQGHLPVGARLDPAVKDDLDSLLAEALQDGGFEDWRGNSRDLDALTERLAELSPEERAEWIAGLDDEELEALRDAMTADGDGVLGIGGNSDGSRRALLDQLLRDADPSDVERISELFPELHPDGRGGGDAAQGTFDVNPDGTVTPPGEVVPEDASWRDVSQGAYGDCVSMATMAMMMEQDPGWAADHVQDNGNGTVTVTLYDENGDPEPITMPKELPAEDGQVVGAGRGPLAADPSAATWPSYVERALAIQMGGEYSGIEGHGSPEVGPRLTGLQVETIPPTDPAAAFDAARAGEPMIVGTSVELAEGDTGPGDWRSQHGYWVDGVSTNDSGEEVIVLRNPHGPDTPTVELTREEYEKYTSSAEVHHD